MSSKLNSRFWGSPSSCAVASSRASTPACKQQLACLGFTTHTSHNWLLLHVYSAGPLQAKHNGRVEGPSIRTALIVLSHSLSSSNIWPGSEGVQVKAVMCRVGTQG